MMWYRILFIIVFIFVGIVHGADFDTININASLDTLNKEVRGIVSYSIPGERLSTLEFQLFPNVFSNADTPYLEDEYSIRNGLKRSEKWGSMTIDSVIVGGENVTGNLTIDYTRGIIDNLENEEGDSAEIYFVTRVPLKADRLSYNGKEYLLDGWYPRPAILKDDGSWYNPEYGSMSELVGDFYFYDVRFAAPPGYVVAGSTPPDSSIENDINTLHYFNFGPAHGFSLSMSPDYLVAEKAVGDVKVSLFYREFEEPAVARTLEAAKYTIEYMTRKCGAYHYSDLSLVFCDIGFAGGIEMPGLIALSSPRNNSLISNQQAFVTIHEVIHEWFFGMVGSDQIKDPWMDEGITEFFTEKVIDDSYGVYGNLLDLAGFKMDARDYHRMVFVGVSNRYRLSDPVNAFVKARDYFWVVYSRGELAIETIDNLLGDKSDSFWKSYFENYKFKHPDKDDFTAHLKNYLNDKQYEFALNLIETPGYLDVGVTDLENDYSDSGEVAISFIIEKEGLIEIPIKYMVELTDGDTLTGEWYSEYDREKIELMQKYPARVVVVDPDNSLPIDVDLFNNSILADNSTTPAARLSSGIMFLVESVLSYLGGL